MTGAQVRRNWRRWFTHRDRNRCSPVLPGGGGAKAGRVSVERLTAVTDRSATGISEDSLPKDPPHLLPRPWSLLSTLRPWSVVRTLSVVARVVSRCVSRRAGRRARAWAIPRAHAPHRGTHPGPPYYGLRGLPRARTTATARARSEVSDVRVGAVSCPSTYLFGLS